MRFDDAPGDEEPQPEAAPIVGLDLREALEHQLDLVGRNPGAFVANPPSPAISSVFVVSTPMRPVRPVRGMVRPFSAGLFLTLSGVSPWAICQASSPRFMSSAVMRPYGGFTSGRP